MALLSCITDFKIVYVDHAHSELDDFWYKLINQVRVTKLENTVSKQVN